jgi:hypothetical protein
MYNNGISLNAASYRTIFTSGSTSGRLVVPVKPGLVKYAQLAYVHGTAAKEGQKTVSLDRIHILNSLIDQLVSMSKKAMSKDDVTALTDQQKDAIIKSYEEQIHSAIALAQQPQTYGLAGLMPEAGTLVNITA